MAGVDEGGLHAGAQVDGVVIVAGVDIVRHAHGVLHGVDGLHQGAARPLVFPVLVGGVALLNVGGVGQHDFQQLRRGSGGENAAPEPLAHQHGQAAGVVDVGMGHQHVVHACRGKGQGGVVDFIPALLQAAVDEDGFAPHLQTVAASGDAAVSAEK